MTTLPRIWIADAKQRLGFVKDIQARINAEWLINVSADDLQVIPCHLDLILISDERTANWLPRLLPQIREQRIPLLLIADGVCDWRNTFENPTYDQAGSPAPPLYQPILADKVACIGRSQVRLLNALGNSGKTELVGIPRLDKLLNKGKDSLKRISNQSFRLCITTARTPFFTDAQHGRTLKGFLDLKECLAQFPSIEPIWRLPANLSAELRVDSAQTSTQGLELQEVLTTVDALITTPSTTTIEGMLLGLPTAVLEYNSNPIFSTAAWEIRSVQDILPVVNQLIKPPLARLWYQTFLLNENLESHSPAINRLQQLIEQMVICGKTARTQNKTLTFPNKILAPETHNIVSEFLPQQFFPFLGEIKNDVEARVLHAHMCHEIATMRAENQKIRIQNEQYYKLTAFVKFHLRRLAQLYKGK